MHLNGRPVRHGLVPTWQHGTCTVPPGQQDLSVPLASGMETVSLYRGPSRQRISRAATHSLVELLVGYNLLPSVLKIKHYHFFFFVSCCLRSPYVLSSVIDNRSTVYYLSFEINFSMTLSKLSASVLVHNFI